MNNAFSSASAADVDYLLSPLAIRDRTQKIYDLTLAGKTHFTVNQNKFNDCVTLVLDVIQEKYPDLKIPFHSRWGHFQVGGIDRIAELNKRLASLSVPARVKAKLDLVIVSVLLDAGAGMSWRFREESSGKTFSRSEGLAVASYHMFLAGQFSSDKANPYQVDAKGLANLTVDTLNTGFQVTAGNPLVGVEGRLSLLQSLGRTIESHAEFFGKTPARPGNLLDYYTGKAKNGKLSAVDILQGVLRGLGSIWPGRIAIGNTNLGDVWRHPMLGEASSTQSLVAFHKLSQWMTYSLIEPLMESGLDVHEVEKLTGLAEYRNGGLILDTGLVSLKDPQLANQVHTQESELVVEWRALTVVLLDKIAKAVREKLNKSEQDFPLAKVLEGGTWWAGRKIASSLRQDGGPPLKIATDGTLF